MLTRLAPLVCGLLLVLAGCSGDETTYQPCNSDGDCDSGFICVDKECREAPACESDGDCAGERVCVGGKCQMPEVECVQDTDCADLEKCETGQCVAVDCRQDSDCGSGFHCDAYVCVADECVTDADCGLDEFCEDGRCKPREVTPCTDDTDCQDNELCLDDACVLAPSCADDSECPQGTVCEGGRCARPCAVDGDCPQLYVCRAGHCLQQCISDATCQAAGTICEGNVCVPAQCSSDEDCTGELVRCQGGRCETYTPCTDDSDCDPNFVCIDDICEELPTCSIDDNCVDQNCPNPPCVCKDGHCHQAASCATDADCEDDEDCIGGLCLVHHCRGPADCDPGQTCVGGECIDGTDPGTVVEVIILTPGGPIYEGQSIQLEAIALTANGQEVPAVPIDWTSSQPGRAAVDAAGLLTGGGEAGETDVTATAPGSGVTSDPVTFNNILQVAAGSLRVTVVNASDRGPVDGATVMLDDGAAVTSLDTGPDGTATFTDPQALVDIHVFSDAHDYVSIIGTISTDILVPLPPRSNPARAGGFTGQMTFTGPGAVSLGLAGSSIGGQLVDLNFGRLLGEIFTVTVEFGTTSFDLTLPAQMVLGASFQGFPIPIKDTYYVLGRSGLRTAWGLGGTLDSSVLMDIMGGGGTPGEILLNLLPYFAVFDHGLMPTLQVVPMPLVVDADDIDGDTDTTEMRPDWTSFADVDITPAQPQEMTVYVEAPNLPTFGGDRVVAAVFVAGSLTQLGLTPLGLTSARASVPEGALAPMRMKLAPAYGGLELGRYTLMVLAVPSTGGMEVSSDVAMVLHTSENLPADVTFSSFFLAFPEDASYAPADREMQVTGVDGAALFRSTIQGDQGTWVVYLSNAFGTVGYTLPDPPAGMDDLASGTTITVDPIALETGMTFEDLVTFTGEDLDQLNRLMTACTRFEL